MLMTVHPTTLVTTDSAKDISETAGHSRYEGAGACARAIFVLVGPLF